MIMVIACTLPLISMCAYFCYKFRHVDGYIKTATGNTIVAVALYFIFVLFANTDKIKEFYVSNNKPAVENPVEDLSYLIKHKESNFTPVPNSKLQKVGSIKTVIMAEKHLAVNEKILDKIVRKALHYADKHGVDATRVLAIVRYESSFKPDARAKTSTATGLMQVIARWHPEKVKGRDLTKIDVALDVGAQVLAECKFRAKGDINKAMKCYRGMDDTKYFSNIAAYKKKLDGYLVASM